MSLKSVKTPKAPSATAENVYREVVLPEPPIDVHYKPQLWVYSTHCTNPSSEPTAQTPALSLLHPLHHFEVGKELRVCAYYDIEKSHSTEASALQGSEY